MAKRADRRVGARKAPNAAKTPVARPARRSKAEPPPRSPAVTVRTPDDAGSILVPPSLTAQEGETFDPILGGLVRVLQRQRGYRFSVDAVLLADFASTVPASLAADLGSGSGVVALLLAAMGVAERVVGLEVQPSLAALARRSVLANGLGSRVEILVGDLKDPAALPRDRFDLVVSNPPFHALAEGPPSPNRERAIARHEVAASIADVARTTKRAMRSGGRACFVFPAPRLAELLSTLAKAGLFARRLRLVHPRLEAPAELCLVEARKERASPLEVLSPLILHEGSGEYTETVRRILRG